MGPLCAAGAGPVHRWQDSAVGHDFRVFGRDATGARGRNGDIVVARTGGQSQAFAAMIFRTVCAPARTPWRAYPAGPVRNEERFLPDPARALVA